MDRLIAYKTAELAKEKGFDLETTPLYRIKDKKLELPKYDESSDSYFEYAQKANWNNYSNTASAPTQTSLQKWLREEHCIDVQAYLIEVVSNGRQLSQDSDQREYTYRIYQNGLDIFVSFPGTESYEDALEEGLLDALKFVS